MQYQCSICSQTHDNWPALGFNAPFHYDTLSDEEKESMAELSSDFCIIYYEDQTNRFIRAILFLKVNADVEPINYGIWVSLSEKSFTDYKDHFHDNEYEGTYFGYICNNIPGYDSTLSVQTNVVLSKGGQRPEMIPHRSQEENPFVDDYYNGISLVEAERRLHEALN